ncbi:MAG: hypothetical protein APF80_08335 [Alphaproteobacteria bacterium BRH_c36]|nr:MAG: hypothetical protein APF80_08335 [Alphaproteobacteria bacterium BRH_c36]
MVPRPAQKAENAAPKNRFDREDRERLRDNLIAYMERRSIGVPTLQKEIAIANDVSLDRIPLSTLQRFLSNTHRTNDAFVRLCHVFAQDFPADDPVGRFAGELKSFFAPAAMAAEEDTATAVTLPARLHGYATDALLKKSKPDKVQSAPGAAFIVKFGAARDSIRYAELECAGPAGTVPVRERLLNWGLRGDPPDDPEIARAYEGAAILSGASAVIILRNLLTRRPRTYFLRRDDEGVFVGSGSETATALDTPLDGSVVDTVKVKFTPEELGG